jgi:hypothetical protein
MSERVGCEREPELLLSPEPAPSLAQMGQGAAPTSAGARRAERQLILLSAGVAARRRAMHARAVQLLGDVSWSRLAHTLYWRRLLPTLGPRILELAGDRASDDFAAAVEQALETGRRQSVFLQFTAMRVMDLLTDAGIRCSPLKGPLMGEALYGDPGRRLSSDIDLLVAPDELRAAVEVVRGLGYEAPTDYVDRHGLPLLHFALAHGQRELPSLELHWRVHWYERGFSCERLLPPTVHTQDTWHPARADELAALLLFYARDGFVDLRLASDLSAWWDAFGAELRAGALDELLCAYPAFARVIPVAATVAERVVGLPAAQIISDMPGLGPRERMAVRLADPNPRASQHQLFADTGLVDGLLAPTGGLGAFIRRKVVLPREILEENARREGTRRVKSQFGYSLRILVRFGLALLQVAQGPEKLHSG